jgi:hypothetical protein
MSRIKFLMVSVAFAITYIACDLFFIFYIANKTDTNVTPAFNTTYQQSYQPVQNEYASNTHFTNNNRSNSNTKVAAIVE